MVPGIKVSENRRCLIDADGSPFFFLADTAWELFHRLDRAQTLRYLRDRAAKRFTVIQAVALAELDGLRTPNTFGQVPFVDEDPARPVEAYWAHVDWAIARASELGLRIALLPTWGDKWNLAWGAGPVIFTPDNAHAFGQWIGERYGERGVIWVLGGDRKVETNEHRAVMTRMAQGIREGAGGRQLMTFHPPGGHSSSDFLDDGFGLDFDLLQTGHARNGESYNKVAADVARRARPVIDGEPGYEDHPAGFDLNQGFLDAYDCRKSIYWATFAGACGHAYGAHPIWQFMAAGREPLTSCRMQWEDALHLPGAGQMQWCRALLESRPFVSRIPDQSLVASSNAAGTRHVRATRDEDGSYALVYVPYYDPVTLDLARLRARKLDVWWFDPRDGTARQGERIDRGEGATRTFHPPRDAGPDWVLVLDDFCAGYGRPGSCRHA